MRPEQRAAYNELRDDRLPHVVRHIGLTGDEANAALSSGLGDAIELRRQNAKTRRAKTKAQKAARRRNR